MLKYGKVNYEMIFEHLLIRVSNAKIGVSNYEMIFEHLLIRVSNELLSHSVVMLKYGKVTMK